LKNSRPGGKEKPHCQSGQACSDRKEGKMYHKFLVTGVELWRTPEGIIPGGQMKSQARKASHAVPGAEDQVGPVVRFERYGRLYERALTRRELVFGVKAPEDGKGGGFAGLVVWRDPYRDQSGEVIITPRAQMVAGDWIVQFVREVIVAAGWTIEREEPSTPL